MFSIWDAQCRCYLHSGRNCKTKEECIEYGYEYLTADWDDDDINETQNDKEGTINMCELFVEEHSEPIEEEYA